jgi:hypothetical protein
VLYDGQQSPSAGSWQDMSGHTLTQILLDGTAGTPVTVRYVPTSGFTGTVQLSGGGNAALVHPAAQSYQVYDPEVSWAQMVEAEYDGFPGLADTLSFRQWDERGVLVLDHPTGLVREDGEGGYWASIVTRRDMGGRVKWDTPAGWTGGPFVYTFNANRALGSQLSPTDRTNYQADTQAAMQSLVFAGDITTVAETLTNPLKAQLFAYYLLTNSTTDTAGNYIVRNASGTIIQSLDGDTTVTLFVQKTGGQLTISPHRAS